MKKYLGAELFFESLYYLGIRTIFGLPGGYVLKVYDVLPSYSKKIKHILTRHEQAATHMADGFARASELPGIVLCTSGPAATNTVAGITTAYMDSVPVLIFTGQVPVPFLGSDAFQEADHIGITRSCTKHNTLVRKTINLPKAMAEAYHISTTGRKGPVLVDMPKDVLIGESEFKIPEKIRLPNYEENPILKKKDFENFESLLNLSDKPLLVFGRGSCDMSNMKNIKHILKKFAIPSLTSLMSLGVLGDSENNFGMLGDHGSYAASELIRNTDLLISIGCDLNKILPETLLQNKKIVVVDIDEAQLNYFRKDTLNIHTNSKFFIDAFKDIKNKFQFKWEKKYLKGLHTKNTTHKLSVVSKNKKAFIFHALSLLSKDETIICSDFSYQDTTHQQFFEFKDYRNNILAGGNGIPGYGFPAAIGAKFARPKTKVVSVSSGANFQFNMQEMIVAREQNLDLSIIVVNERGKDKNQKNKGPDYTLMGEAFGVKSFKIDIDDDIKKELGKHLNHQGTRLIEIVI